MQASAPASSGGISVVGLLGAVLVVLKLLGKIDISWWWVTAPFWIPAIIGIVALVSVLILAIWASK